MAEHVYDPVVIESKWQRWWEEHRTNEIDLRAAQNPYYVLMMFPYPSAEGLHVGNVYAFTGADVHGRHMRLRGYDVFEPIGYDAFGIHSENFAMKVNRHPSELIPSNIRNFERQLRMMGLMFDWRRTVDTTQVGYYKWTQWIFLQLYKAGYAYRDEKEVNYCPDCGTVIADEQVNPDGTCERHSTTMVQRRKMPCWFFKTTAFAEELATNHEWLDWAEKTQSAQRNWIGRSTGAEVDFVVEGTQEKIRVFTTRPDTLFGATFLVMAPDHPLVEKLVSEDRQGVVAEYRKKSALAVPAQKPAIPSTKESGMRTGAVLPEDGSNGAPLGRDAQSSLFSPPKTGVALGAFAINPVNDQRIPIFIADYVLMGYGTGAIMAVPAHDERDFAFARQYGLPIRAVVRPDPKALAETRLAEELGSADTNVEALLEEILEGTRCWSGPGTAVNSANAQISLNGLGVAEAKKYITEWLVKKALGDAKTTFRLRDWGISRQRYWGPPIPIIYDEEGNAHPVPEDELPVALPPLTDFRPKGDGRGPLAMAEDWVNTTLPDGRPGRRETDVMDNFLDSAWYFLRYVSTDDPSRPYDPELIKKWLPVDMYIGGNEHAVLHLLYTRFICHALTKSGALKMGARPETKDPGEPFRKFRAHGLIVKDGSKMSKSKGNIVNPDQYVQDHGADTLRLYLLFLGPYLQGGDFRDKDIMGMRRFLNRLHTWYADAAQPIVADEELPRPLRVKTHQTLKKVAEDMQALSYNTSIAAVMELFNDAKAAPAVSLFLKEALILCLAPFTPHFAEEIWQVALGKPDSIWAGGRFPTFDPALTKLDEVEIVLQHNGRIRERIMVPASATAADLEAIGRTHEAIIKSLAGKEIKKVVAVPGRLVNVIG